MEIKTHTIVPNLLMYLEILTGMMHSTWYVNDISHAIRVRTIHVTLNKIVIITIIIIVIIIIILLLRLILITMIAIIISDMHRIKIHIHLHHTVTTTLNHANVNRMMTCYSCTLHHTVITQHMLNITIFTSLQYMPQLLQSVFIAQRIYLTAMSWVRAQILLTVMYNLHM